MAPKKKQPQQQRHGAKGAKTSVPAGGKTAPRLAISAENERRLRRLLMNTERPESSAGIDGEGILSREQKAKKLRSIYDKLSLEGFTSEQIERALFALAEGATFEAALDWLCFNLRGDELPLKFSSAGSVSAVHEDGEISVKVISRAQENWVPTQFSNEVEDERLPVKFKIKGEREEASIDIGESSQADWIKKYVRQLEEDEEDENIEKEDREEEVCDTQRTSSVVEEYHLARFAALEAKRAKDKKKQSHFNEIIRNLKQEIISLGLLDEIKAEREGHLESSDFGLSTSTELDILSDSISQSSQHIVHESENVKFEKQHDYSNLTEMELRMDPLSVSAEKQAEDDLDDLELPEIDSLFSEDFQAIPAPEALNQCAKRTSFQFSQGEFPRELFSLWKRADSVRSPKALLQKICQHLGWDAPKYAKILEKERKYAYSVNILRTAMGRGKSRKAGGLITFHLANQEFTSVEHAQNSVAAFALYQLFPDYPIHELVIEPYVSTIRKWQEGEQMAKSVVDEDERRSGFVENLLNVERSSAPPSGDVAHINLLELPEEFSIPQKREKGIRYNLDAESDMLKREMKRKLQMSQYREMQSARSSLPVAALRDRLLLLLKENDALVVCGETGCGKTTQVPQFILDDMIESGRGAYCNIICTQPRRIAAISVAERVSEERCEPPPGCRNSLVGYQVRLDSARSERTKLLFCTTGILLRRLSDDKDLVGVTHVIVDEVHERSLLGDFLLIVLKNLIERQALNGIPKLKVVLMSATVDSTLFSRYLGNCPVITAKGRTYPVVSSFLEDIYEKLKYCLPSDSSSAGRRYTSARTKVNQSYVGNRRGKKHLALSSWGDEESPLDEYVNPNYNPSSYEEYSEQTRQNLKRLNEDILDYDLLEDLIFHIDNNWPLGAILVFLPGVAEIYLLIERLRGSYHFKGTSSDWILPLHSTLSSLEQKKVFLSPPRNIRKRMSSIVEDWISRANAKQRQGRAGRVKPGNCFFLYTRYRFEQFLRSFQVPEILRVPLTEVSLQIKSLGLGDIRSFLTKAIEAPREEAILAAIDTLREVGAIEDNEKMTPLGYHLAKLPVDVLIGKMMLYGAIFGCLSPILSVAAFLSHKSPFLTSKEEKETTEKAKLMLLASKIDGITDPCEGMRQSDHLLMIVAYKKWSQILHKEGEKAAQQFCRSYSLSSSVMFMIRDIRIQFGNLLADIGLINLPTYIQGSDKMKDRLDLWFNDAAQTFNTYSNHPCVVRAIICAGLYPNVAATEAGITGPAQGNIKEYSTFMGSKGSSLWHDGKRVVHIHPSSVNHNIEEFRYPFLVYLEKIETSKVFLRETTIISPYSVLLFGGALSIQHQIGVVIIDGWLKLKASAQTAVLFKELRSTLHAVLRELIKKPEVGKVSDNEVVRTIVHLLLEEDKQ
ncbi:RNA helicase family protein isoform X2 [Wolffia australiana]